MKINHNDIKDTLKGISLFGAIPELAFNAKLKKNTLLGFLGSTLMLGWVILSCIISFEDMI